MGAQVQLGHHHWPPDLFFLLRWTASELFVANRTDTALWRFHGLPEECSGSELRHAKASRPSAVNHS